MITNDTFLKACRCEEVSHTPVWFMRQAGRYMPSYRAIRSRFTMLELCQRPEEITQV
ncbi:MAG: uroporphyrinogen decarboxylase, partial [Bdellovibrionales bacterium]|nr:uroporphyrinogen decarboxylase [Bdellovibrionales bacterium]